jgi:3-phenylpropionate/trans-cinnamate dioxygenase ferredoxin reductase subunit
MPTAGVVVAGAGNAGYQVAVSLRENHYEGRIVLVGEEADLPYQRPPLSKGYLLGKVVTDDLIFRPRSYFDKHAIEVMAGVRALAIDRARHRVALDNGETLAFEHLVLATGARPRGLPCPGADLDGVTALRTVVDAEALARRLQPGARMVVIGGGFIGLETAAVARELGLDVVVIEALPRLMARAVAEETSIFYAQLHRAWGTEVLLGDSVIRVLGDASGRAEAVETVSGRRIDADVVVVGVGVVPNVELAVDAGLAQDDGVVVDAQLQTADPMIYAVGDCARFPCPDASERWRLESVQNAADQAKHVARRIVGVDTSAYDAIPWFWSDQRDVRLQIVGITTGYDETLVHGHPDERTFSVLCYRNGVLIGADSVNAPRHHMALRRVLGSGADACRQLTKEVVAAPEFDLMTYAKSLSTR